MLEIRDVSKIYRTRGGLFSKPQEVHALRNVSLGLARGTTYGLVGESGSGKTTLTRCILRLEAPTSGAILFEGEDMGALSPAAMRRLRARVQIVFQDPYASLNPRMSIHDIIAEPMVIHRDVVGLDRRARSICTAIRTSSPAASASASASRALWRPTPLWCFSTSPPPPSTCRCRRRCSICCTTCKRVSG